MNKGLQFRAQLASWKHRREDIPNPLEEHGGDTTLAQDVEACLDFDGLTA